MLKKSALRRITTSTIALFIVSILCFFPKNINSTKVPLNTNYIDIALSPIYLINKDNYVIRTTFASTSKNSEEKIKEAINALTINNQNEALPSNFRQIIPQNTRLLNFSLEDGLLKINFSKEFLNVPKNDEEKLIEALVYTLTEIPEIKEIMLFIENQKLEYLPQTNTKLPNTLTRNFGINKVYDITNIKNLTKTTIYYIGKENDLTYYIPVTKINNNENDKVEIIIEELKSSPIYETNLRSYLASSVELLNYETLENQINLSFNNKIFDDFNEKNILEEVKYSIALSLQDTLNIKDVVFKVDDEVITTFK